MKSRSWIARLALLATVGLCGVGAVRASAGDEPEEPSRTPPRLSLVAGEVSFWRPGADDWSTAHVNLPLAPGDALYTGEGANLELQIAARAFVRAGELTQLRLDDQEPAFLQLSVTTGHLALDLRALPSGHAIEVDTPNAAILVEREGYYRLRVAGETTTFSARRGGLARIRLPSGAPIEVAAGERVVVDGTDDPTARVAAATDPDVWDRWNYDRTDQIADSQSRRYVSEDVYGLDSLDRYGTWRQTSEYGPVWVPASVPRAWVPYSTGRWIWDPYFGWTWLDEAPWGWAPYHYGRWVYTSNYWAWAPGPIVVRPYYAPALVAFFGGGGVGVHVSVGAPLVGWVALGWGEPFIPWWGRPGFIGRPCWYGWGGPRIVHHHTVVNVNKIHIYKNARVPNAVLGLDRDRFGRGRHAPRRLGAGERDRLGPVRGSLGVTPVSASLTPSERRGRRPPAEVVRRPVVATRRPQDPSAPLRAQGLRSTMTQGEPSRRLVGERPSREVAASRQSDRLERVQRRRATQPETSPATGAQRSSPPAWREPRSRAADRAEPSRRPNVGSADREKGNVPARPQRAFTSTRRSENVEPPPLPRWRDRGSTGAERAAPKTDRPSPSAQPPRRVFQPRATVDRPQAPPPNPSPQRREWGRASEGGRMREGVPSQPSSNSSGRTLSREGSTRSSDHSPTQQAPSAAAPKVEQRRFERPLARQAPPPAAVPGAAEQRRVERPLARQVPSAAAAPGASDQLRFERPRSSFTTSPRADRGGASGRGRAR
jgi:hypothetical protein